MRKLCLVRMLTDYVAGFVAVWGVLIGGLVSTAHAAPTDLYRAVIMGTWMRPLPIFAVKMEADRSLTSTAEIELYQFDEATGTKYLATVVANVVMDTKDGMVLETAEGVTPYLKLTVDRRMSYSTAPFTYSARIVGGVLPVQDRATYTSRELNPARPEMDTAVGVLLSSVVQGRLGGVPKTCQLLFAP